MSVPLTQALGPMTIRQLLYRRVSLATWPTIAFVIVSIALLFVPASDSAIRIALIALGMILLLVAVVMFTLKCPRCGGPLGSLAGYLGPLRRFGRNLNYCPFCATSLDDSAQP